MMFGFLFIFTGQCALDRHSSRAYASRPLPAEPAPVLLPAPPVNDEYLPCDDCHEDEPTKFMVRGLDDHQDTQLNHGDLWCLDCHGVQQHEKRHLSDGSLIDFDQSWRLCTRCHYEKLKDWRAGLHGKRTGHWRGAKDYRTCVACHRPHSPHTEDLEPKPRPLMSSEIELNGSGREETSNHGS